MVTVHPKSPLNLSETAVEKIRKS